MSRKGPPVGWFGIGKGRGGRGGKENEKRGKPERKTKPIFHLLTLFSYLDLRLPALLVYALGAARGHELAAVVDFDDSVDDRDVCFFLFWRGEKRG